MEQQQQPIFVTALDSVTNPQELLARDFVDSIYEQQTNNNHNGNNSPSFSHHPISLAEFRRMTKKALEEANNQFDESEITAVLTELNEDNGQLSSLYDVLPEQHLYIRRSGLPNISFVKNLKKETIDKNRRETPAFTTPKPIKSYPFSLSPTFYVGLIEAMPALKYEFKNSVYLKLVRKYAETDIPKRSFGESVDDKVLKRIKIQTIKIARLLSKTPSTLSLLQYSKHTAFPERALSTKTMNLICRKQFSATQRQNLLGAHTGVWNCLRCAYRQLRSIVTVLFVLISFFYSFLFCSFISKMPVYNSSRYNSFPSR